jgi:hypothetical protein
LFSDLFCQTLPPLVAIHLSNPATFGRLPFIPRFVVFIFVMGANG